MFNLEALLRPHIRSLVPYASARDEFSGTASVYLDANENSYGSPLTKWYHRYPDPHQLQIKEKLSAIKAVPANQIFLGNGSDECIDLLYRAFCTPGKDNVVICPPTYGMYEVSAHLNDVEVRIAPLLPDYQLDLVHLENLIDAQTKIIWLCSPNNPTGNSLDRGDIEMVLNNFDGLVVVDEAYINFSRLQSYTRDLVEYPNLVVLQTLSKAWGLAGLRVGMAFASVEIIEVLDRIKPPYNINQASQELVLKALDEVGMVNDMIREIVKERELLSQALLQLSMVDKVQESDANFLLVTFTDKWKARDIYEQLLTAGIVVRDRSKVMGCPNALRITIGTENENKTLIALLKAMNSTN
jgi:histidinol-phosphate aminotransferase